MKDYILYEFGKEWRLGREGIQCGIMMRMRMWMIMMTDSLMKEDGVDGNRGKLNNTMR